MKGIEPLTFYLQSKHSTIKLHPQKYYSTIKRLYEKINAIRNMLRLIFTNITSKYVRRAIIPTLRTKE